MDSNEATGMPAQNSSISIRVHHFYANKRTFKYEIKKLLAATGCDCGLVLNPRCKRHISQQVFFYSTCGI
jgi:hypothetical protein